MSSSEVRYVNLRSGSSVVGWMGLTRLSVKAVVIATEIGGGREMRWSGAHKMVGDTFTIGYLLCFLPIVTEADIFLPKKCVFDGEALSTFVAEWLYYIAGKAQELKVGRQQLGAINFVLMWQHGPRFMSSDVMQSFSKNNLLSYIPLSDLILTLY